STFSLYVPAAPSDLHSFPTRRSSDLVLPVPRVPPADATPISAREEAREHRSRRCAGGARGAARGESVRPGGARDRPLRAPLAGGDRKSTRLNSSHLVISYAVFCLKKK